MNELEIHPKITIRDFFVKRGYLVKRVWAYPLSIGKILKEHRGLSRLLYGKREVGVVCEIQFEDYGTPLQNYGSWDIKVNEEFREEAELLLKEFTKETNIEINVLVVPEESLHWSIPSRGYC